MWTRDQFYTREAEMQHLKKHHGLIQSVRTKQLRYCMANNSKLTCVQTSDYNSCIWYSSWWCFTAIHSVQTSLCALLPQLAVKLVIPHLGRAADRLDQKPLLCSRPNWPTFSEQLLLSTWSLTGFPLETMPDVCLETHVKNGGTTTRK